jgi:hypothetical protein
MNILLVLAVLVVSLVVLVLKKDWIMIARIAFGVSLLLLLYMMATAHLRFSVGSSEPRFPWFEGSAAVVHVE